METNRPRRLLLLVLLATLGLAGAACGSADDSTVASVGSATLSQADLEAILEGNDVEDTSTVSREVAARHISEWILFESWIGLAAEGGTEIDGLHLDLARREQEAARAQDPAVPAVGTAYGRIMQRYRAVPHLIADHILATADVTALCSSHLLVETETEAAEAIARLDDGEDFAALAAEVSVGPSGPSGGDLGCVAPATFVPEFVEGAAAVGGAGISAPVQSQFGWHVIAVRSFGPVVRGEHAELTPDQVTALVLSGHGAELEGMEARLFDRDISVDARFGVFDPAVGQVTTGTAETGTAETGTAETESGSGSGSESESGSVDAES
ncbi:MAG: peptidylprolyl isomerase [Acidimicrobiia bacterium]|nr:peptidylprolyl isomerase [Acidimicrobiia bacterium]